MTISVTFVMTTVTIVVEVVAGTGVGKAGEEKNETAEATMVRLNWHYLLYTNNWPL